MLALPCAVALALLSIPLVATLFHHGAFDANDVLMTRKALVAYSIGLLGLILVKVLAPGFYARQDIKTPVKIGVFTLAVTQAMNVALVWVWRFDHAGLALAISLGACLNAGLLYYKLRRHRIFSPQPGWPAFALKLVSALAVMAVVLWFSMGSEADWLRAASPARIAKLAMLVVAGAVAYLGSLWAFGFRLRDFAKRAA